MSNHHHHHHHHHHGEDRERKIVVITIVVIAIVALTLAGIFLIPKIPHRNDEITNKESVALHMDKNNLIITLGGSGDVYVKFGHYDVVSDKTFPDFAKENVKRTEYECKYNGEYTISVYFKSGTVKTDYVNVTANDEPVTIKVVGDKMKIVRNSGFSIQSIEYCYGERLGDPFADYLPIDKDDMEAQAFGNGWHTFRVFAIDDKNGSGSYYIAANVTTCTEPIVMFYKNAIGIFSQGFDVTDVIYSKGRFTDWDSLAASSDAVNAVPNCMLSIDDFDEELYTFGFKGNEEQYFITVNVDK